MQPGGQTRLFFANPGPWFAKIETFRMIWFHIERKSGELDQYW
jgi:hypothetical protein